MGAPSAANVIRVLSINVIFDGLVSTPVALIPRVENNSYAAATNRSRASLVTGSAAGSVVGTTRI